MWQEFGKKPEYRKDQSPAELPKSRTDKCKKEPELLPAAGKQPSARLGIVFAAYKIKDKDMVFIFETKNGNG